MAYSHKLSLAVYEDKRFQDNLKIIKKINFDEIDIFN